MSCGSLGSSRCSGSFAPGRKIATTTFRLLSSSATYVVPSSMTGLLSHVALFLPEQPTLTLRYGRPVLPYCLAVSQSMHALDRLALGALYALLLWAPIASGAYRGWPLATTQLLTLAGLLFWVLAMLSRRRLEWRRSALDLPLLMLVALVLIQLALGNGPLVRWALAPPPADLVALPARFFTVGTVAPAQTARSFLLFLTYAGVYVLVVNLVRSRQEMSRLLRALLLVGSLLAFLGLLDYLGGEAWLTRWRDHPFEGRLTGTFVNPDHFAAWLGMLVCLGTGSLLGRGTGSDAPVRHRLRSRQERERLLRRYLPVVGVGVMTLALVFTLSRGGIVSLVLSLAGLLGLMGALGRIRLSLVFVGILLTVTLSYGAWIGLGPLLERFRHGPYDLRIVQSLTTLPMISAFPLLGVGLGAYRDIYFRYQPPALAPGTYYLPFAHNDWLQLVVELGLVGTLVCAGAIWRVGRDLLAAHLLGRGRCPVGAGEAEGARRNEPLSVGIALGALAGVFALVVHSGFDFGARIPANGILAAVCLGIATVALHTRFAATGDRALGGVRVLRLGSGRRVPAITAAVGVILAVACIPPIIRPAWVEGKLAAATGNATFRELDDAARWAPRDAQVLATRGRVRLAVARQVWDSGRVPDGSILPSWEQRRRAALTLLDGAVVDLRAALSLTPTDPFLHETLGWVYGTTAVIDPSSPGLAQAAALGSLRRAIALQPENPFLYRSLAVVALSQRAPLLDVALGAGRAAVERAPELLADLTRLFLPATLTETQWLLLVPATALDRLELAVLLEQTGLPQEAAVVYRRAIEVAPGEIAPLVRFRLAQLLMRRRDAKGALGELDLALEREPDNPDLHLARARALASLGDAAALDAYRAAIGRAEARAAAWGGGVSSFRARAPRARSLAEDALDTAGTAPAVPYRRALAEYLLDRKLWALALEQWTRVLAERPQDAAAHAGRGRALAGLSERDRAVEAYRKAVALDGRSVAFRLGLAESLWDTRQYYQAINEWRTVIGQNPGHIEARLALARAYLEIGERIEAFREYRQVWQMAPDQPEALRALSRLGGIPNR